MYSISWKLLQCIFSTKKWIWSIILDKIKQEWNIFAYSKKEKFFKKNWFQKLNKKSESGASLYLFQK
jgi:hypothetical protein